MAEIPPPLRSELPPAPESRTEVNIRKLNPENPQDLDIARTLDGIAAEAYNPFAQEKPTEASHDLMTDEELKRWAKGSDTDMLRVIEDKGKTIGFTYLYNDSKIDSDFQHRAQKLRKDKGEGSNHSVWEMNYWVNEGTPDAVVETGVKATLNEFAATRTRETTMVMFIAEEDLKEAVIDARTELGARAKGIKKEDTLQDTRVLDDVGFRYSGTMQYAAGDTANRAYSMAIGPKTSF